MYKNEEEYEFFTQKLCKCGDIIPEGRVKLGYKVCVQCSTVEQYGCVPITYHKTGNSIQIMSSEDAATIAKLTRRKGYGTMLGVILALFMLSSCATSQAEQQYLSLDNDKEEFYSSYDCENCDEID